MTFYETINIIRTKAKQNNNTTNFFITFVALIFFRKVFIRYYEIKIFLVFVIFLSNCPKTSAELRTSFKYLAQAEGLALSRFEFSIFGFASSVSGFLRTFIPNIPDKILANISLSRREFPKRIHLFFPLSENEVFSRKTFSSSLL